MICGLLGEKLNHSYSPAIHKMFGGYSYELFEVEERELENFLRSGANADWDGLNVTIPYKKSVIPFLDELDESARATGSVNTIVRRSAAGGAAGSLGTAATGAAGGYKLVGYNTDVYGFEKTLDYYGVEAADKKVLILGNGGAAAAVRCVLEKRGARVVTFSRHATEVPEIHDAEIIVNATPVGMYPNNGEAIISLEGEQKFPSLSAFPNLTCAIDLIYNPARTKFLLGAERLGIKAIDGLYMLVAQAARSCEIFQGSAPISDSEIENVFRALNFTSKNIILIGMPGVGKTTEGRRIAAASGREFFDTDEEFEEAFALSAAKVIEQDSEEKMRAMEARILAELGEKSGAVIATGGGCVTRSENYDLLHQNGIIVWLDSPLESLETIGRPLSRCGDLKALYDARKNLYETFADIKLTYGKDEISYESISDKWSEH